MTNITPVLLTVKVAWYPSSAGGYNSLGIVGYASLPVSSKSRPVGLAAVRPLSMNESKTEPLGNLGWHIQCEGG